MRISDTEVTMENGESFRVSDIQGCYFAQTEKSDKKYGKEHQHILVTLKDGRTFPFTEYDDVKRVMILFDLAVEQERIRNYDAYLTDKGEPIEPRE